MKNEPSKTSSSEQTEPVAPAGMKYIHSLRKAAIYYFIGVSTFFILGFLVIFFSGFISITLRVTSGEEMTVPDLVGSLYLNEHNQLLDSGYKIELKRFHTVRYPEGYILAQNLSPGSKVKEGAKLVLHVNQSENIIEVPELTGVTESLSEGLLSSIPVGGRRFKLNKGTITRIPDQAPKGEILAQFPPAGTPVVPNSPVALLVSDGPDKLSYRFRTPDLDGVHIEIIKQMAHRTGMPVRITTRKVEEFEKHGRVLKYEMNSEQGTLWKNIRGTDWQVEIGRFEQPTEIEENKNRSDWPYEIKWFKASELNITDGRITLGRVENAEESEYTALMLLAEGSDIPVFTGSQPLALWQGEYREKEPAPIEEDAVDAPEDGRALFDEPVEEKDPKETATEKKPVKIIEPVRLKI